MRLIDADALEELFREVIAGIAKRGEVAGALEHLVRASAMTVEMIRDAPTVELTNEAAIEHLHKTGWMQNHDREITRPPWVSVKERLPGIGIEVLVLVKSNDDNYEEYIASIDASGNRDSNDEYLCSGDGVTHWMPLPEPPEEGDT